MAKNINRWALFVFAIYLVLVFMAITTRQLKNSMLLATYGIIVTGYILSRFLLSYFYEAIPDNDYEPSVTFVVPAMNEGGAIKKTLEYIYQADYPREKIEVITINDGSTDNTLDKMREVKREHPELIVVNWRKNKGKKRGMAKGVRLARGEIIVFIDSDSFIHRDSIKPLVKYFQDREVGAVTGHTDVYNWKENYLTKMQAARYFISFDVEKSAEGLFGCVTCCAGCFSAYRREYVLEVLDDWVMQKTLGVDCHYGDDRSLTNYLLRKYKMKYAPEARASTIAPHTTKQFFKQQLRWKKSWVAESFRAMLFIWKKNPLMALSFYAEILLTFLSPIVLIKAFFWDPAIHQTVPFLYLMGLILISFVYALFYYIKTGNKSWWWGAAAAWFYAIVMIWQLPYAILTLRDAKWGTR
ncbi:MAG: hypothetical protein A2W01_11955 [Candidatus Solincola sediminis]|uniref:Uncharacterized protein n=1 Tax=Candidatus Solincola sediminis TaxID=1797199 RepID=A0A1F2WSV7_9ACTN|nr:MAG: hypothetical protein A2Y75_10505 [Candidatus Solincola sediminis]OFW60974.1 MAG: hypothetical protein A2W01_11955 [Candidatus Solincola sediminis]